MDHTAAGGVDVSVERRRSAESYIPGQNPGDCTVPGKLRFTSTYPVVKQNLFQDCNIPRDDELERVMGPKKHGNTTLKVQVVSALFGHRNNQVATRRGNGLSKTPLQPLHALKTFLTCGLYHSRSPVGLFSCCLVK